MIHIKALEPADIGEAVAIWNDMVEEGIAFPQLELLDAESGRAFFASQSFTGVAVNDETGEVLGFTSYIPTTLGAAGTSATRATQ